MDKSGRNFFSRFLPKSHAKIELVNIYKASFRSQEDGAINLIGYFVPVLFHLCLKEFPRAPLLHKNVATRYDSHNHHSLIFNIIQIFVLQES